MTDRRPPSLLLLGPTGSGKTPLGEVVQARGWRGRRAAHFDFGAQLRRVEAGAGLASQLTAPERERVGHVLRSGALLEDEDFALAGKILRSFTVAHRLQGDDLLVLNGLPRHRGQAQAMDPLVRMEALVHLRCPPGVVRRRLRADPVGDRLGRSDDDETLVTAKLEAFHQRTAPLVAYYRDAGVPVLELDVAADTRPEELWQRCHS
ncbi:MAG: nucleoside monophosphate kinase [Candidatus Latescibacterota bacterium]